MAKKGNYKPFLGATAEGNHRDSLRGFSSYFSKPDNASHFKDIYGTENTIENILQAYIEARTLIGIEDMLEAAEELRKGK